MTTIPDMLNAVRDYFKMLYNKVKDFCKKCYENVKKFFTGE